MLKFSDRVILFPLWLLSRLPISFLLAISWVLSKLLYYVVGYRKKVVWSNLKNAFPEKSQAELKRINKRFYLHLCDLFFESMALMGMSKQEILKRYLQTNKEVINELYAKGKNLIVVTSHYGNWEWACSSWYQFPYKSYGIYKPLSNKLMDRFFLHLRSRFGGRVEPMKNTLRIIVDCIKNEDYPAIYLVGDQRPMKSEVRYWIKFMNQDTPVVTGPEKLAVKFDFAVVFIDIQQEKRGKYKLTYKLITEEPKLTKQFEITDKYFFFVEEQIKRRPELYLWTHKRWKFKKEDFVSSS